MARGNPYARGGDVMKTRSEKRKEKQAKLSKTNRVMRLKRRLGRIAAKKFARQEDSHMTALMESYIIRRKAERAAEKAKEKQNEGATCKKVGAAAGDASRNDEGFGEDEEPGDEEEEESSSYAFSLGSNAEDSAFEIDEGDYEDQEEEEADIATSRRKAAEAKKQHQHGKATLRVGFRGGSGGGSWSAKRGAATAPKQFNGRGGLDRGSSQRSSNRRGVSASNYNQRSRKVPTRSLY